MKLLAALYRIENLQRAWRWIRSNPDAGYKTYFREHYAAYTTAQDALLKDLSDRLRRSAYVPAPSCKIYLPKASGILRPYSLLDVEDQIVYQAAANVVAEPPKALRLAAAAGRLLPIVCAGPLATMEPIFRAGD